MNLNNVSRRLFYNSFDKLTNLLPEKRVLYIDQFVNLINIPNKIHRSHSSVEENNSCSIMCNNVLSPKATLQQLRLWKKNSIMRNYCIFQIPNIFLPAGWMMMISFHLVTFDRSPRYCWIFVFVSNCIIYS